jgi:mannose-1-phosphate guanylyltransferase
MVELDPTAFEACPSISIDYAVMEHSDRAAVIPIDAGWADIGSWSSVLEQGPLDSRGNRLEGDVVAIDSEGCLVWSEGAPIGVVGRRT